jgi:glutamine phosphoribosylpyrophosphate amidotransferase
MCVIAGYIGNKQAAPVLLKMLQQEEGLGGGFYSGIATIHEGKLHYAKAVGDVSALIENTQALQLPGTIGIAHSRTASGGGREWGHPFVDTNNQLAYIANGSVGSFDNLPLLTTLSEKLMAAGHRFLSAQNSAVGKYPQLKNGQSVHFSDTFCQAIAAAYEAISDHPQPLLTAAAQTYQDYPNEIVGLCLHAAHPDEIVAVRHNQPCEIGRNDEGNIYLATTSIAFPSEVSWQMRMPAQAGAAFHRNGSMHIEPFRKISIPLGPFPSPAAIEEAITPLLNNCEPPTLGSLCDAVKPLWPEGTLNEKAIAIYETLASMLQEKRIYLQDIRIPGVEEGSTVPRTRVHLFN